MSARRLRCTLGSMLFAALAIALVFLLAPATALAQADGEQPDTTQNKLLLPLIVGPGPDAVATDEAEAEVASAAAKARLNLIVDSDLCVDDATALLWLLGQSPKRVNLLGIVTVAGCTDLESATDNALTVRDWMGKATKVIMGGGKPSLRPTFPSSVPIGSPDWLLFGPNGLWFVNQHPYNSPLPIEDTNADAFYCDKIQTSGRLTVTVLALGPLTNIADALNSTSDGCADLDWSRVEIIALGGAKNGGNATPTAESNFWHDPEAANIVLERAADSVLENAPHVTLVPLDAFTGPTVDLKDVDKLEAKGNAAAKLLAPALRAFVAAQSQFTGRANIPDAVAAVYALDRKVGTAESALVKMVLDENSLAYGQSIVALTTPQRVQLIAEPADLNEIAYDFFFKLLDGNPDTNYDLNAALGGILWSEPDNAQFVTAVQNDLLTKTVLRDLSK